jgi:hypothetical protein
MSQNSFFFQLAGGAGKVGFSKAMSAGWILLDKSAGAPTITRKVQSITDTIKVLRKRSKVGEDKWRDIFDLHRTKI